MKRDKELIKAILEVAESHEGRGVPVIKPENLPNIFRDVELECLIRHGILMIDYGLIKGNAGRHGIDVTAITWAGYDFLDNARNPKVWNIAKQAAGELSWEVFVTVLTATATDYAKSLLKGIL